MTIKTTCTTLLLLLLSSNLSAQFLERLKNAAERGVKNTVERKIEQKSTKTTEDAMDGVLGNKKSATSSDEGSSTSKKKKNKGNSLEEDSGLNEEGSNQVGFKRGNRIIFQDTFEKDAIGDFPARWNTTKGGEIKMLKGMGKFLKVPSGGVVYPELTKNLPDNFTVEFDLVYPSAHPYRNAGFGFGAKPQKIDYMLSTNDAATFDILSADISTIKYRNIFYGEKSLGYQKEKIEYSAPLDKVIKIAFEVNGKRIRMFVNGDKKVDLPTQFKPEYRKTFFISGITNGWQETKDAYFYIGNLVIAETGKDERSSVLKDLMEKGSFSTNAILFASGSDKILPQSNEVMTQIADALKQSTDMKITIIGHTDSDGDDASNLALSKKRANAVKMKLASMGINASRLTADGKGESEPVADNSTTTGKAQNRRVEFIKQ